MYSSNLVMSEEIEDEFYKEGDVTEGHASPVSMSTSSRIALTTRIVMARTRRMST